MGIATGLGAPGGRSMRRGSFVDEQEASWQKTPQFTRIHRTKRTPQGPGGRENGTVALANTLRSSSLGAKNLAGLGGAGRCRIHPGTVSAGGRDWVPTWTRLAAMTSPLIIGQGMFGGPGAAPMRPYCDRFIGHWYGCMLLNPQSRGSIEIPGPEDSM
ncbi:hypothetical protein CSOJ01_09506 [Colletotrichum sojae]|uniref:Uncharacterized protein n=1 Tax=Colletotrichum sojae TaxID=2175907 RepID=A0A8H6J3S7_9PEZI|nr:hypothetical protein CSOJ01_09506 [Colletotrichum sojae]